MTIYNQGHPVGSQIARARIDEDSPIPISTDGTTPEGGGGGYYTPPGPTVGIFSDDFNGNYECFPNRGKWIKYVGRDAWTGGGYSYKGITLTGEGELGVYVGGIGEGTGTINVGILSRAEFKTRFKTTFIVRVPDVGASSGKSFEFALVDPNPPDHVYSTHLFGIARLLIYAEDTGDALNWYYQLWGYAPVLLYGGLPYDEEETITVEQVESNSNYVTLNIDLTGNSGGSSTMGLEILPSKSETYRIAFNATEPEAGTGGECKGFYLLDVKVERPKNKISRAIVTVENLSENQFGSFYDVSQDLVSIRVAERENSCLSLAMVLNAPRISRTGEEKYSDGYVLGDGRYWTTKQIRISSEVEVRAGWDYMMWLLFRGDIDELDYSHSDRTLEVVSSQAYGKMLDWRETDEESYSGDGDVEILDLVAAHYDEKTELSADWIMEGDGLDISSDDETVASIIAKLTELNEYATFIDFNRSLVFWSTYYLSTPYFMGFSPTLGNLESFNEASSDTVINDITVIGMSDSYQVEDSGSINDYGRRQKTFKDESLTSLGSVTSRAVALLKEYSYPRVEYDITSPENFVVSLYDLLWWETYPDVSNWDDLEVKSVEHTFHPGTGLRTKVEGNKSRFRMSDVMTPRSRDTLLESFPI